MKRFMIIQENSKGILSCKQRSKKKQANYNKIVHLIISGSQFIWVKHGFHIGIHCLHQAYKLDFMMLVGRAKLESNDYPLLQHSKVKLVDICIHTLLRTCLVHIVIYRDHS
jgi:hypothetical protein